MTNGNTLLYNGNIVKTETKICTRCGSEKSISEFYKDKTRNDCLSCWCRDCIISVNSKQLLELKTEVLTHYGNGKLVCVKCGFDDIRALSIDHLEGGGYQQRKSTKMGGNKFYRWLKKNEYPTGFQTLCMNCQFLLYNDKICPNRKPFIPITKMKLPISIISKQNTGTRDTVILPVRIKKDLLKRLNEKVTRKRVSRNSWMIWAILNGLRSHKKRTAL